MPDPDVLGNALKQIQEKFAGIAAPNELPAPFLMELTRLWKEAGGKLAGKPRHSDRYLDDQLRNQGTPVRSLTPKLAGKTRISPTDGRTLVRFFLTNWPEGESENEDIRYSPILEPVEINAVAELIATQLSAAPAIDEPTGTQLKTAPASPVSKPPFADGQPDDGLPGSAATELIEALYRESDALITVAPEQVLVASGSKTELIGFRGLIDSLRQVELQDGRARPLIWVLDLGGPSLEDLSTRRKYLNVQQLIVRLKALKHYKDYKTEEVLEWLISRGTIIVHDTYGAWRKKVSPTRTPPLFSTHHASLTTTTTDWMANSNFRTLYGSNLEEDRMRQRVFQVFFNASGEWSSDPTLEADLRYVGFASFMKRGTNETAARALELPPLPARYAEAFKTVCAAAAARLDLNIPLQESSQITGDEAIKQLEYLGYRVLTIDEFLKEY